MKVTKRQLRRIIKEERTKLLKESRHKPPNYAVGYNTAAHVMRINELIYNEMLGLTGDPHWDDEPENVEVVHAWLDDLKAQYTKGPR